MDLKHHGAIERTQTYGCRWSYRKRKLQLSAAAKGLIRITDFVGGNCIFVVCTPHPPQSSAQSSCQPLGEALHFSKALTLMTQVGVVHPLATVRWRNGGRGKLNNLPHLGLQHTRVFTHQFFVPDQSCGLSLCYPLDCELSLLCVFQVVPPTKCLNVLKSRDDGSSNTLKCFISKFTFYELWWGFLIHEYNV